MIKQFLKMRLLRKRWRKKNSHNFTIAGNCFDLDLCSVGNFSYGVIHLLANVKTHKLIIGSFVSIANDVQFILADEHSLSTVSTFPIKRMLFKSEHECFSKGDIVVEDDVWIGSKVQILSSVRIGQGAVIAAGAVVTKDVPPYAVVGGVPAKVIKYRFPRNIIEQLLRIDYSTIDINFLKENLDFFYKENFSEEDVLTFLSHQKASKKEHQ